MISIGYKKILIFLIVCGIITLQHNLISTIVCIFIPFGKKYRLFFTYYCTGESYVAVIRAMYFFDAWLLPRIF